MKEPDPISWVSRAFGACLLLLLAAMALDGAVHIVEGVWVQLTLGLATIAALGLGVAVGVWWYRRF